MMVGSFKFNNIESESFKLVCKSVKRPLLPSVKSNRVEMLGKSGVFDFSEHEYGLRKVTMRIQYIGTDYTELRTRARQIAAWLSTATWAKLILNDEPDKHYLAKVTDEIDLESLWESGKADISFDCQPFALSNTEVSSIFSATGTVNQVINNPGTRLTNFRSPQGSKFSIKADGSWTKITFAMNGNTITYNEAGSGELILDNVNMTATLSGVNKFGVLTGDVDSFLKMLPGANTLTVSGTGINVTVTVTLIPLWI